MCSSILFWSFRSPNFLGICAHCKTRDSTKSGHTAFKRALIYRKKSPYHKTSHSCCNIAESSQQAMRYHMVGRKKGGPLYVQKKVKIAPRWRKKNKKKRIGSLEGYEKSPSNRISCSPLPSFLVDNYKIALPPIPPTPLLAASEPWTHSSQPRCAACCPSPSSEPSCWSPWPRRPRRPSASAAASCPGWATTAPAGRAAGSGGRRQVRGGILIGTCVIMYERSFLRATSSSYCVLKVVQSLFVSFSFLFFSWISSNFLSQSTLTYSQ